MMINFAKTKSICGAGILLLLFLTFSGCGEFAYKRGANASDLEAAKKSCGEKEAAPSSVAKCLSNAGWTIQNLAMMESIEPDPVIDASVIPSDRRIENPAVAMPHRPGSEGLALSDAGQPTTIEKITTDMADTFKISSWWKAGSGAVSLKSDTEECVAKLGEAHRPNSQTQQTSRGFLLCMKGKGWSGLRTQ
jgi:hypothetical protein